MDEADTTFTIDLTSAGRVLLEDARSSSAGRSARSLHAGQEPALQQTLMAILAGRSLGEHESPGAATLQVLEGRVRLVGGTTDLVMGPGELATIPPVRHGLDAQEDAVVLLTVART